MRRNTFILLIIFLLSSTQTLLGQYEGLDSNRRQSTTSTNETPFADEITTLRYKDLAYSGMDFSAFGGGISYSIELSPYTGIQFNDRLYLAAGATGSIFSGGVVPMITTVGGVFSFVRVPISNFFIHAEYRFQNAITDYSLRNREWYGTPILGGGYNNDGRLGMYALVGVAFNSKFNYTNALGPFIYRFGFRF